MKFQMIHENYNVADLARSEAFMRKHWDLKSAVVLRQKMVLILSLILKMTRVILNWS